MTNNVVLGSLVECWQCRFHSHLQDLIVHAIEGKPTYCFGRNCQVGKLKAHDCSAVVYQGYTVLSYFRQEYWGVLLYMKSWAWSYLCLETPSACNHFICRHVAQMGYSSRLDWQLQHSKSCSLDKSWFIETRFIPASCWKGYPDVKAVKLPQLYTLRPDTHLSVRREQN